MEGSRARVRDALGQFKGKPDNAPEAPRKYGVSIAERRRALLEAATPDAVKKICLSMVELAQAGDVGAAALILDKVVGRFADNAEGDEVAPTVKVVTLDITPEMREELSRPLVSSIVRGEGSN